MGGVEGGGAWRCSVEITRVRSSVRRIFYFWMCVVGVSCKEETITKASSSWKKKERSKRAAGERCWDSGKYILTGQRRRRRYPQGLFSLFEQQREEEMALAATHPKRQALLRSLFRKKKKELFLLRRRKRSGHFAHVGHGRDEPPTVFDSLTPSISFILIIHNNRGSTRRNKEAWNACVSIF